MISLTSNFSVNHPTKKNGTFLMHTHREPCSWPWWHSQFLDLDKTVQSQQLCSKYSSHRSWLQTKKLKLQNSLYSTPKSGDLMSTCLHGQHLSLTHLYQPWHPWSTHHTGKPAVSNRASKSLAHSIGDQSTLINEPEANSMTNEIYKDKQKERSREGKRKRREQPNWSLQDSSNLCRLQ